MAGRASDDLEATIDEAIERAAIAGLCREGQLELAVQEARRLRPDLADDKLIAAAEAALARGPARG